MSQADTGWHVAGINPAIPPIPTVYVILRYMERYGKWCVVYWTDDHDNAAAYSRPGDVTVQTIHPNTYTGPYAAGR